MQKCFLSKNMYLKTLKQIQITIVKITVPNVKEYKILYHSRAMNDEMEK